MTAPLTGRLGMLAIGLVLLGLGFRPLGHHRFFDALFVLFAGIAVLWETVAMRRRVHQAPPGSSRRFELDVELDRSRRQFLLGLIIGFGGLVLILVLGDL